MRLVIKCALFMAIGLAVLHALMRIGAFSALAPQPHPLPVPVAPMEKGHALSAQQPVAMPDPLHPPIDSVVCADPRWLGCYCSC